MFDQFLPTLMYRISDLRAELETRSKAESALKQQARSQEVASMELEASLSRVKEDLAQRQIEVSHTLSLF